MELGHSQKLNGSLHNKNIGITTTEVRLMEAAIALYGRFGIQAVSLNQIRKHAKVANESAVRYYFLNKTGLVRQCVQYVADRILPSLSKLAQKIESSESVPDPVTIILKFRMPIHNLFEVSPDSVRFLASLIRDANSEERRILTNKFGEIVGRYENLLAASLPNKNPEWIHIHFLMTIDNILHGLSDRGILRCGSSISDCQSKYSLKAEEVEKVRLSFVLAGICSLPVEIKNC